MTARLLALLRALAAVPEAAIMAVIAIACAIAYAVFALGGAHA